MKFHYRKLLLQKQSDFFGASILKPIIPISLLVENKEVRYEALIDSGADFCIFDAKLGEYLGLDVKSGMKERFGGIQRMSGAEVFLHKVFIAVGGWRYFTTVGFSYHIADYGFGVLGQKGFFDIFIVKFDLFKEEVELIERKH